MKKPSVSQNTSSFSLRRLSAAALLCCAVAGMPAPVWAAPGDEAALNFVGADIESVIKAVGHYTNINFVIDPRVKGTITLVSEKSISKTQAFALLASALRLQGYAVVSGDGYAKVVPEADAKLQSVPTQVGNGASQVKGDQIATQVFYLNYESSANLVAVLRPLISPNNTINANPGNNSLVITDYADNLKRLAKIIAALDVPASTDLDVIPVRYAIASDLASMVNKLMEGGSAGAGAAADGGKVSVLADPRTNSLVLRAPSAARANLAKSLISKLDQPTNQLGNVHVVYLKNADATKLAQTLRSVVTSDGTAATAQQGNTSSVNTNNQNSQNSSSGMNSTGLGGSSQSGTTGGASLSNGPQQLSSGGAAGFIQADVSTNTLILTCNEAVYRNLRAVIDQLDVRRAQVYIEALIVEVTSSKASEFGVQWLGLSGDSSSSYRVGALQSFATGTTNNIAALATGNGAVLPTGGLTLGIFKQINGALGLGALAHALESDGNANILSTPNLITLDNELASIKVGQNVPILTGQYTSTAGTNTNPFQTIDRKEVGLTLKVRPQISEGGTIKLAIYHETSSVDKSTSTAVSGITINNRVIENNVLADDGQIIVLGGLIEDSTGDNAEKVRGLGDIPLIGNLFKYQTRERKKTNLMIFLRPVIVRNKEQSGSLAADRYDYMRSAETAAVPATGNVMLKDLGTPVLPALQDGQPVGGNMVTRPVPPAPTPPPGAPANAATPPQSILQQYQQQQQPQPQQK
ncbi:type II secretion system secretin GspD [Janthinobacterium sp. HLX7-2]|uniref:type II secretion system secretin GspD n=1 Tax=Janthinobacterium sp. HLX7-2 TaxID=1259331 RepID=UPI003F2090AD